MRSSLYIIVYMSRERLPDQPVEVCIIRHFSPPPSSFFRVSSSPFLTITENKLWNTIWRCCYHHLTSPSERGQRELLRSLSTCMHACMYGCINMKAEEGLICGWLSLNPVSFLSLSPEQKTQKKTKNKKQLKSTTTYSSSVCSAHGGRPKITK